MLQYLLLPALYALLVRTPQIEPLVRRYLRPWIAFAITMDWMTMNIGLHKPNAALIGMIASNINVLFSTMPLWVLATMYHPQSWTTRLLELPMMRFLGRLFYSLYLWHILFFELTYPGVRLRSSTLVFLGHRPWRYLASGAMALFSYFLIEKPMIRLGHRLAPPSTPGHRDLTGKEPLFGELEARDRVVLT